MFELLFKHVSEKIAIGDHEKEVCYSLFITKKLRKKHFLLKEGEPCKYLSFVEKGLLRSYTVDEKGSEHIIQFAPEGWWIADIYSLLTGEPSEYNIDAVEDTEMLVLTPEAYEELMVRAPAFERYYRLLMQNSLIAYQRRVTCALTRTAEETYTEFLRTYPHIAQRVPQHNIASYLGITPESLSRIRRQMAEK